MTTAALHILRWILNEIKDVNTKASQDVENDKKLCSRTYCKEFLNILV